MNANVDFKRFEFYKNSWTMMPYISGGRVFSSWRCWIWKICNRCFSNSSVFILEVSWNDNHIVEQISRQYFCRRDTWFISDIHILGYSHLRIFTSIRSSIWSSVSTSKWFVSNTRIQWNSINWCERKWPVDVWNGLNCIRLYRNLVQQMIWFETSPFMDCMIYCTMELNNVCRLSDLNIGTVGMSGLYSV